jgi:hypothetical protein
LPPEISPEPEGIGLKLRLLKQAERGLLIAD